MLDQFKQIFRRKDKFPEDTIENLELIEQKENLELRQKELKKILHNIESFDIALFVLGRLALREGMSEIDFSEYWSNPNIYGRPRENYKRDGAVYTTKEE